MRRGSDESPTRLLLLLELTLHGGERPRQIADLVAGAIDRNLDAGTLAGELQRSLTQTTQATDETPRPSKTTAQLAEEYSRTQRWMPREPVVIAKRGRPSSPSNEPSSRAARRTEVKSRRDGSRSKTSRSGRSRSSARLSHTWGVIVA